VAICGDMNRISLQLKSIFDILFGEANCGIDFIFLREDWRLGYYFLK
jgi:hypothetical protein